MSDAVLPIDDDKPTNGEDATEDSGPEDDFVDADFTIQMIKFDLIRLKTAIAFVQNEVPPYGTRFGVECIEKPAEDVPPSIDLCRRRALVSAYACIERGFSPRMEADREDA